MVYCTSSPVALRFDHPLRDAERELHPQPVFILVPINNFYVSANEAFNPVCWAKQSSHERWFRGGGRVKNP